MTDKSVIGEFRAQLYFFKIVVKKLSPQYVR